MPKQQREERNQSRSTAGTCEVLPYLASLSFHPPVALTSFKVPEDSKKLLMLRNADSGSQHR